MNSDRIVVLENIISKKEKNRARKFIHAAIAAFRLEKDGNEFLSRTEFLDISDNAFKDSDSFGMYWAVPAMVHLYSRYREYLTESNKTMLESILESFYFVCGYSVVNADAKAERVYLSENHDFLMKSSMYLLTKNIPEKLVKPLQGRTVDEVRKLLLENIHNTFDSILKDGWLIEGGEPYNAVTLESIYNIMELSDDGVLAKKAKKLIDVFWIIHAQETINGVRGFARSRVYPYWRDHSSAWISSLFGIYTGIYGVSKNGEIDYLVSFDYELPNIVFDILKQKEELMPYTVTIKQRGAGFYVIEKHAEHETEMPKTPMYYLDNYSKIQKTTYMTKHYCVSGFSYPLRLPTLLIASQNKWEGISYAEPQGVSVCATIYEKGNMFFDSFVTMHHKNRIIYAQNKNAYVHIPAEDGVNIIYARDDRYRYNMKIWIESMGKNIECTKLSDNLLVFKIDNCVFAAETDEGFTLKDEGYVVKSKRLIITAGSLFDETIDEFIGKVQKQENTFADGRITSNDGEDQLIFNYDSDSENIRMINGRKIDYWNDVYIESPFINSKIGKEEFVFKTYEKQGVVL